MRKFTNISLRISIILTLVFTFLVGMNSTYAQNASTVCAGQAVGASCSYPDNGGTFNGVCVRTGGPGGLLCRNELELETCRQDGDVCIVNGTRGRCDVTSGGDGRRTAALDCIAASGAGNQQGAPDDTSGGGAPDDTSGGGAPDDTAGGNADTGSSGGNGGGAPTPQQQSVSFENPISANSIPELIATIIRGVLGLLGAVAVAIIVYAGFTYMTAGGNSSKTAQATTAITNAVIGLVVIMGAFLIVDYVISAIVG